MKQFIFCLFLCIGCYSYSQVIVSISPSDKVCFGVDITLTAQIIAPDSLPITVQWLKNGATLTDSTRTFLVLTNVTYSDTGVYICIATNGIFTDTSNRVHVQMYPKLIIDTLYRYNELGCPRICKGQFLTHISGGNPPYTYNWGGGHAQDTIVFGLCPGNHTLLVTDVDTAHCIARDYYVDVLKLPKLTVTKNPKDTVYLTHPTLTLSFPDS